MVYFMHASWQSKTTTRKKKASIWPQASHWNSLDLYFCIYKSVKRYLPFFRRMENKWFNFHTMKYHTSIKVSELKLHVLTWIISQSDLSKKRKLWTTIYTGYITKKSKSMHSCSQQHHSQQPKGGSNPSVHCQSKGQTKCGTYIQRNVF